MWRWSKNLLSVLKLRSICQTGRLSDGHISPGKFRTDCNILQIQWHVIRSINLLNDHPLFRANFFSVLIYFPWINQVLTSLRFIPGQRYNVQIISWLNSQCIINHHPNFHQTTIASPSSLLSLINVFPHSMTHYIETISNLPTFPRSNNSPL